MFKMMKEKDIRDFLHESSVRWDLLEMLEFCIVCCIIGGDSPHHPPATTTTTTTPAPTKYYYRFFLESEVFLWGVANQYARTHQKCVIENSSCAMMNVSHIMMDGCGDRDPSKPIQSRS
jgi:hypothetical protein